ncbi:dof zinc finger protein DOF3.1 [Oryza sativa Japonica Group]|nr:hypothetical protein DAI22_01g067000 [Oryza sativa Japonica Group]
MLLVAEGRTVAAAAAGGGGLGGGARTEAEGLACPRCESTNTKFCYYNNYNLAQPRHFCKACRRYWTRGGALRNVPVGGGTRNKVAPAPCTGRRKRAAHAAHAAAPPPTTTASSAPLPLMPPAVAYELPFLPPPPPLPLAAVDPDRRLLDLGGSFTSLLAPAQLHNGHFTTGFLLGTMSSAPPPPPPPATSTPSPAPAAHPPVSDSIWAMGWPHLSI